MLRRLTAYFLALLCLFSVPAHAADIADLAILSQWDERFQTEEFRYLSSSFRYNGCGPASVANGLIAALDVTDQDLAAGIMRDVLYLLTKSTPKKRKMQIAFIGYLNFNQGIFIADERYPSINQALLDFGGAIRYYDVKINAQTLPDMIPRVGINPVILHGSLADADRWTNLRAIIQTLTDAGYEDARIVLSFLGAGVTSTQAPFRSGTSGHYLSICIPMASFLQTGQFYVLDSLPRALFDEPYGLEETFLVQYDFVGPQKYMTSLKGFNALFEVERVTPTIVRVVPKDEALQAVESAEENDMIPLDALLPYLNQVMSFYGTSHIFIRLPGR